MDESVVRANRVLAIDVAVDDASMPISPADALAPDGTLILMSSDSSRTDEARGALVSRSLMSRATIIGGDPRRMLYKLAGPFDIIFCRGTFLSERELLHKLLAPHGVLISNDAR